MLSSIVAGSCKKSRICHCKFKTLKTMQILQLHINATTKSQQYRSLSNFAARNPTAYTMWTRRALLSTEAGVRSAVQTKHSKHNDREYDGILSAALDQSNVSLAQSLIDTTFSLVRRGNTELAWECYLDLKSRQKQQHLSREQYRQLIRYFNHHKPNQEQGLEFVLTLVEDMKKLGYSVGQKEKLIVMRLLGLNGKLSAMEQIFKDLSKEQLLVITDPAAAQKPFNVMLSSYFDNVGTIGGRAAAEKAMELYGEMLDRNIQPSAGTTCLLMDNIRAADKSDEMVEQVWSWVWTKIGMNVGGKTKELEPSFYRSMVMYFSSTGRAEYALEINDIMKKKKIPSTVPAMTALIHKVGRSGNINKAMDLLNEMVIVDGLVPSLVTFNVLIDIHAHKSPEPDVLGANRMYQTLTEVGLQPDKVTFSILIDMFAKQGDLDGVKRVYKDMVEGHHIEPTPYIYSSLIEYFSKAHDHASAKEVLMLLKKQWRPRTPYAREAYNLIFRGLVMDGHIQEGVKLLGTMVKEKIVLEPRTFTPLLSYYAKRGDVAGARNVAGMLSQAGIKPNSHIYSILLNTYARAGDIEGAENIFNIYKKKYRPDAYIYNALLYLYTLRNEMDKVLDTYKRMSKSFVPANVHTYGILMNFYSRRKELKAVEALMNTMESNGVTPSVVCWTNLMQTYFECDKAEKARKVIERMVEMGMEPSVVSWGVLISGSVRSNQLEFAESVLHEAIDKAKQSPHSHRLLKDASNPPHAYEKEIPDTIEDILYKAHKPIKSKHFLSPHLFTPVIDAYTKEGNFPKAKELFKTMCDLSVDVSIPAYTSLMNIFNYENRFDVVETLWNAIYKPSPNQHTVEDIDPLLPTVPLPTQAYDYSNLLTLDETDIEEPDMLPVQVTPFALSIYIDSLVAQSRFDSVETLWEELTLSNYCFDEQNWNRYITSLLQAKKLDKACELASKQFLEPKSKQEDGSSTSVTKSSRSRDDIFTSNDSQLHTRTCILFADAFQIAGAESMGKTRLRAAVSAKIKEHMYQKDRLDKP